MKYLVSIREVWVRGLEVAATSEEEAKIIASNVAAKTGDDWRFEYSHELDKEFWTVEEIE